MANLRVTYDPEADVAYIYLTDRTEAGEGVIASLTNQSNDLVVDFDPTYKILGFEFLKASLSLPKSLLDQAEILDADRSRPPGD